MEDLCVCMFALFTVSLIMHAGEIINLCNPTRQEAKATMKFQRVIENDNLNGSVYWMT